MAEDPPPTVPNTAAAFLIEHPGPKNGLEMKYICCYFSNLIKPFALEPNHPKTRV